MRSEIMQPKSDKSPGIYIAAISIAEDRVLEIRPVLCRDAPNEFLPSDIASFDSLNVLLHYLYTFTTLPFWISRLEYDPDSEFVYAWDNMTDEVYKDVLSCADCIWNSLERIILSEEEYPGNASLATFRIRLTANVTILFRLKYFV